MKATISRDVNGNTIVKLQFTGCRGWSIQTNGNLPETHRTGRPDVIEIRRYIMQYGTLRQKRVMDQWTIEQLRISQNCFL